ncbi:MAG: effector binding domain-containing protein [Acidobacteriota bacterium]|nr:effector binding domain-containing protein [Acidobacteriota bacterium]
MKIPEVHFDSFEIVGIEARTTNAREATPSGVIGAMWARLGKERFLDRIPHRVDSDILVLFTDYESNKDGAYTYVLGTKVSSAKELPVGFVSYKVPAGSYAEFKGAGTQPAKVVLELWQKVWALANSKELNRAYKTDFEVHAASGGRVQLYIGLKD